MTEWDIEGALYDVTYTGYMKGIGSLYFVLPNYQNVLSNQILLLCHRRSCREAH